MIDVGVHGPPGGDWVGFDITSAPVPGVEVGEISAQVWTNLAVQGRTVAECRKLEVIAHEKMMEANIALPSKQVQESMLSIEREILEHNAAFDNAYVSWQQVDAGDAMRENAAELRAAAS